MTSSRGNGKCNGELQNNFEMKDVVVETLPLVPENLNISDRK